jgi:hypothetical protein
LDGKPLALRGLTPTGCRRQAESVVYRFAAGDKDVEVVYELKAGGAWNLGDKVILPIKGPQAMVLGLFPAGDVPRPVLLGAHGEAALDGDRMVLRHVQGPRGTTADLTVLLPAGRKTARVEINGRERPLPADLQGPAQRPAAGSSEVPGRVEAGLHPLPWWMLCRRAIVRVGT